MKVIDIFLGLALLLLLVLASSDLWAAPESDYSTPHCLNVLKGEREAVLPDKTRVDCLTDKVAWEYDFGKKWYEAIGQALWYAMWTARDGGVVLIVDETEGRFVDRAKRLVSHYQLPIHVMEIPK